MVAEAGIEPALRGLWDLQGLRPFPPHRELVWSASWRGQRDSNPYSRADNAASFPSTMSPSGWSARGDSNPDLHGLNVPRLPIAPRADVVTMDGFEPPLDRLSTCCLCPDYEAPSSSRSRFVSPRSCSGSGYMAIGPSGWTRTTTSQVKNPECCVDTTEGVLWSE
jgi:hypothetical protein